MDKICENCKKNIVGGLSCKGRRDGRFWYENL